MYSEVYNLPVEVMDMNSSSVSAAFDRHRQSINELNDDMKEFETEVERERGYVHVRLN